MAIGTYAELQAAILSWMDRADITASTAEFVALAESRLNRIVEGDETDATLTGTAGSRSISIASLALAEPIALFLADSSGDEIELTQQAAGTFPFSGSSGTPRKWCIDGDAIKFDCPLSDALSFRFRYRARLALSASSPTNGFLTKNPDAYLAAAITWGCVFVGDAAKAGAFRGLWDEFVAEHAQRESQKKRGKALPDAALARISGATYYATDGQS